MPLDVTDALLDLARVFSSLNVRWYVFGAQAVIAAGVPRLTADVDVTVEVKSKDVPALIEALRRAGFAMREVGDVLQFVAETRVVPALHVASAVPVDIILAGPGLEEEMLGRVATREVRGVPIPYLSLPDLIALKMLAGRSKDHEDVRGLIRAASPALSLDEARDRVGRLGEMLEDGELLSTFDHLIASARPASSPAGPKPTKKRRKG